MGDWGGETEPFDKGWGHVDNYNVKIVEPEKDYGYKPTNKRIKMKIGSPTTSISITPGSRIPHDIFIGLPYDLNRNHENLSIRRNFTNRWYTVRDDRYLTDFIVNKTEYSEEMKDIVIYGQFEGALGVHKEDNLLFLFSDVVNKMSNEKT